jgi:mono/diheme cytochrome c family protein
MEPEMLHKLDTAMKHSHTLVVSLYLLQLLLRLIMMAAATPEKSAKFTRAMRIPHIVLSVLFLGTGIFLMARQETIQPYVWMKLGLIAASIPVGIIGGKRNSVPLTGFAFLLLAGAMALAFIKPMRTTTTKEVQETGENTATIKAGQQLYIQRCELCHGGDGTKAFQGAKDLKASTMEDAAIMDIIRKGKNMMPPNQDFTDQQVEELKEYVKYLRK